MRFLKKIKAKFVAYLLRQFIVQAVDDYNKEITQKNISQIRKDFEDIPREFEEYVSRLKEEEYFEDNEQWKMKQRKQQERINPVIIHFESGIRVFGEDWTIAELIDLFSIMTVLLVRKTEYKLTDPKGKLMRKVMDDISEMYADPHLFTYKYEKR